METWRLHDPMFPFLSFLFLFVCLFVCFWVEKVVVYPKSTQRTMLEINLLLKMCFITLCLLLRDRLVFANCVLTHLNSPGSQTCSSFLLSQSHRTCMKIWEDCEVERVVFFIFFSQTFCFLYLFRESGYNSSVCLFKLASFMKDRQEVIQ